MENLSIFYFHFGILRPFGVFYDHLGYFVVIQNWQPCKHLQKEAQETC
jgi:hypothetical protein